MASRFPGATFPSLMPLIHVVITDARHLAVAFKLERIAHAPYRRSDAPIRKTYRDNLAVVETNSRLLRGHHGLLRCLRCPHRFVGHGRAAPCKGGFKMKPRS